MPTARFCLLAAAGVVCSAQPTVAPSPEPAADSRGSDYSGYNITNSWEVGYRAHTVGGSEDKYRADVNFGNGIRLLGSHLGVYSRDGKGRLFDELVLTTQGLGNDPYQFANLRVRQNRLYEYNLLWRSNAYFSPALTVSDGLHALDTTRRWQDHELTLFPASRFKGILGYSRNRQSGTGLSTANLFGSAGDEFPAFTAIRRETNEYRAGGEVELQRLRLRVVRTWENFRDDSPILDPVSVAGADPDDAVTLSSFRSSGPNHGNSPAWRGSLFADASRWLTVSARGSYTDSDRGFIVDETATGTNLVGAGFDRQVFVLGSGRRPIATGNATINLFPSSRITVANHTAVYNQRMEGDSVFQELNNRTLDFEQFSFQALGIRTVLNSTDFNYRAQPWFGLYGGYHYSTRRICSRELFAVGELEEAVEAVQENTIHSGLVGLRIQPIEPLTINLDGELGRADHPFYPISENNYHALGGRLQYTTPTLLLSAATRINYNANSVTLSSHSSRSRNYAFDFSWTPTTRFAVDAGYNKMHLDSLSGIAYFAAFQLIEGERSIYISNVHAVSLGLRAVLTKHLDLYAGYSRVQDTGDGRSVPLGPSEGTELGSAAAVFVAAQTFPVSFQSPSARLSWKLRSNLHWNLGYQYYHYREEFLDRRHYRAHTGYASLQWSF